MVDKYSHTDDATSLAENKMQTRNVCQQRLFHIEKAVTFQLFLCCSVTALFVSHAFQHGPCFI
jgi:hypothetical protein